MCFRRLDDVHATEIRSTPGRLSRARERAAGLLDTTLRHPRISIAIALVLALALFGYLRYVRPPSPLPQASTAVTAVATDRAWPGADGGAGLDRASAASPPLAGELAWSRTLPAPAVTSPVVDAEALYIGLADRRIVALAAADGSERWSLPVAGEIDSAPVVVDGTLYLAHRSGRVAALDATTGDERWAMEAGSPVFASPAVADGTVYVASFDHLVGVDAASGEELWRRPLGAGFIQIAPAVAGDHLLVATNAGVRFFDRRTGAEHYGFALRDAAHVSGNAGIALAFKGALYAFDPGTQTPWWWGIRGAWANLYVLGLAPEVPMPPLRWAFTLPPGAYPPVVDEAGVYVAHPSGELIAIDPASGAERWRTSVEPLTAVPVLTGDGLLAATANDLIVIDPGSGSVRDRRSLDGLDVSGLSVTAGLVVLQTGEGADGIAVIR